MKVSLVTANNYSEAQCAIDKTIENLGGLDKYFKRGETIVIKANLLNKSAPEFAVTTHPSLIEALARRLVEFGLTVVVADSPAGAYTAEKLAPVYNVAGMKAACENSGAQLNQDFGYSLVEHNGVVAKRFDIIDVVQKADAVINFAKFKTHSYTGYSGTVKNLFGTIAGRIKVEMHAIYKTLDLFCDMLIDLEQCLASKVRLHFIDAIIGMEGPGPFAGTPKFLGKVIASENPYYADITALKLIKATEKSMPVMVKAVARGLCDESQLEIIGESLADQVDGFDHIPVDLKEPISERVPGFIRPLTYRLFTKYPKLKSGVCVGCALCEKHCPVTAITIRKSRAKFDLSKCIRCYCCQELCPHKAIRVATPILHRFLRK